VSELELLEALPPYLTPAEIAELLNVNERTVWRLINRGELEVRHIGRAARVPRASLIRYLLGRANGAGGELVQLPRESSTLGDETEPDS
jgi:excisionase family DNA binding protein